MCYYSKDRQGVRLYTTARHSPTAFMVLPASSPLYRVFLYIRRHPRRHQLVCTDCTRKRFAVPQSILSRPPDCCLVPAPSIQPAHLGTVCGVLLGTWTLWPVWQRGRQCGSHMRTAVSHRALSTDLCTCLRHAILSSWQT
jgi:hypothetical protein